jgi:hypothetical protein
MSSSSERLKELLSRNLSMGELLVLLIVRMEELNEGLGFFLDEHRHRSYQQDEKITQIRDAVDSISRAFSNGVPVKNYEPSSYSEGTLKVQVTNSR